MNKVSNDSRESELLLVNFNYVKYFFVDINGILRQVEVKIKKGQKELVPLLFDGSSIAGYGRTESSDCWLVPDKKTLAEDHLTSTDENRIGYAFCEVRKRLDQIYNGCPRSILKNELEKQKTKNGYTFNFGFEAEFFLIKKDLFYDSNRVEPIDHGFYFSFSESSQSENLCREITLKLEKYGFEIEKVSHEVSDGQFEINFRFAQAVESCDNMMLLKYVCKKIAASKGYIASFMPKPLADQNGNGLHTNISINKEGKNLFAKDLTDYQKWAINGILANGKGLAVFTNGTVNSYNRLTKGFEAPIYLSFSRVNRSTMIRIPLHSAAETARIEIRSVDAASNVYLASYVLIKSMVWGIDNKVTKFSEHNENLFKITSDAAEKMHLDFLPQSLTEAILHMRKNKLVNSWFSEDFINTYKKIKFTEWAEFKKHVTIWEQKRYLNY